MRSGWTAPTGWRPAARIGGWCACATAPCSTATGTIATSPREESYREDVATARQSRPARAARCIAICAPRPRAAGTSAPAGSRTGGRSRPSARRDLVPVDLNSILVAARDGARRATSRRRRGRAGHWRSRPAPSGARRPCDAISGTASAACSPTISGARTGAAARSPPRRWHPCSSASPPSRKRGAWRRRSVPELLWPGGLVTTTVASGQQWDAPNGWAPLQWLAVEGLNRYGETALAETIAERWMTKVITAYRATGKLVEKYNVADDPGRGRRRRVPDSRTASAGPTACCAGCWRCIPRQRCATPHPSRGRRCNDDTRLDGGGAVFRAYFRGRDRGHAARRDPGKRGRLLPRRPQRRLVHRRRVAVRVQHRRRAPRRARGTGAAGGVAVGQFEIMASLILLLLGWFFVPFYLRSGVFTMPEFLERRYSPGPAGTSRSSRSSATC